MSAAGGAFWLASEARRLVAGGRMVKTPKTLGTRFHLGLESLGRWFPVLPWLIFGTGILLSLLVSNWMRGLEDAVQRTEFEVRIDELIGGFQQRLEANAIILRGVTGLFDSSDEVTREEFRVYVAGLRLARYYPGIQGIGFAQAVPAAERDAHVAAIRAQGFPDYELRPSGVRDSYTAIVYLEPFDWRNRRAFGYDMFSEPVRREAMIRARDTGEAALSGRVTLVQETDRDVQAGFLLYLPIYRHGAPLDELEQRRAALLGWAYSPLRARDLVERYLLREFPELAARIALRIYSGEAPDPDLLLFESHPQGAPEGYAVTRATEIHGARLLVQAAPLAFDRAGHWLDRGSRIVLAAGLAMTLLLTLLNRILTGSHRRVEQALELAFRANRHLDEQKSLLRAIHDSSGVAILLIDGAGVITHANRRLAELFHQPLEQLVGQTYDRLMPPARREQVLKRLDHLFRAPAASFQLEQHFACADGSGFWGQVVARPFHDGEGRVVGVVIVIQDITLRRESEARIRFLAHHDYLTGLPNRARLMEQAGQALALARRHGWRIAILFIDLDRFKPINDHHGHEAGDFVLRTLAARLHALLRESDTICRQGGDEFVILLPEFRDVESLAELADKLRSAIELPCLLHEKALEVSASIGIAVYPDHGDTVEDLIRRADDAMYRAKTDPECRVHFADAPDTSRSGRSAAGAASEATNRSPAAGHRG